MLVANETIFLVSEDDRIVAQVEAKVSSPAELDLQLELALDRCPIAASAEVGTGPMRRVRRRA